MLRLMIRETFLIAFVVIVPATANGPSDGVVSVRSATHPDCQSVLAIGAPHAKVHRTPQASAEVLRVLNQHWLELSASP
jgi:hypothetical protein